MTWTRSRRFRASGERRDAASFVSAARCRDGKASSVASDAADCELLIRTHNKTHNTGAVEEKTPQRKSLQGLIFTQSGRRDLNALPLGLRWFLPAPIGYACRCGRTARVRSRRSVGSRFDHSPRPTLFSERASDVSARQLQARVRQQQIASRDLELIADGLTLVPRLYLVSVGRRWRREIADRADPDDTTLPSMASEACPPPP